MDDSAFDFNALSDELADILCHVAPRHGLRLLWMPSTWVEVPEAVELACEPDVVRARLAESRGTFVWLAGPWTVHPLAFRRVAVGPSAGKWSVIRYLGGPHLELRPPGTSALGQTALNLLQGYAFDPAVRNAPRPQDEGDQGRYLQYPPTDEMSAAFDAVVADIRGHLVRHEQAPGVGIWVTPSIKASHALGMIGAIPGIPADGIRRAKRIARPVVPGAQRRVPVVTPAAELRALDLGPVGALEGFRADGSSLATDEAAVVAAIEALDAGGRQAILLAAHDPDATRLFFVLGGRGGLVVTRFIEGDDSGGDPDLYLLDLAVETDATVMQCDEHGTPEPVPRQWCVKKELAVRAARYFLRTRAPDPDLPWGH